MKDNWYLFGGGVHGQGAYKFFKDKIDFIAFCDNNKNIKNVLGLPCISPNEIPSKSNVLIATGRQHYKVIKKQLEELDLNFTFYDNKIISENMNKLNIVKQWLKDDESRRIWDGIISFRQSEDDKVNRDLITQDQYFCLPEFWADMSQKEVYVDLGAFTGDTIEKFIKYHLDFLEHVYAFEPGEKQYALLKKRCERIGEDSALDESVFTCYNAAVSDFNGNCALGFCPQSNISGCFIQESSEGMTKVVKLDDIIAGKVTFLKMDIEGAELKALKGAEQIIRKYKPKLAICLYHHPYDFFEIPMYIKQLVPEYTIEIRHHSLRWQETVLYCYI